MKIPAGKVGTECEHHRAVQANAHLDPEHHVQSREVLVNRFLWCKKGQKNAADFNWHSPFKVQGYRKRCVWLVGKGNIVTGPAGRGPGAPPATHSQPIRSRRCGHSPAGQDPDHVVGLVAFDADCTVVKVGLRFLQQKQHGEPPWPRVPGVPHSRRAGAQRACTAVPGSSPPANNLLRV